MLLLRKRALFSPGVAKIYDLITVVLGEIEDK
jgi:hypothetical protein